MFTEIKTKGKKILLFFLVFSFVFANVAVWDMHTAQGAVTEGDLKKQISEKQASLTATSNKRKDLENKIASLKNQKADAERDKRNYDDLIAIIEIEIKDTEELIEFINESLEQEETDIEELHRKYDNSYKAFLDMIQFAYEDGYVNYLDLLMNSENFTSFLSWIDIISNMAEYNKNVIENLQKNKKTLNDTIASHEEMISQLDGYASDLAEKSQEAAGYRKDAIDAIKKLADDIVASEAKQAQFDQESKDIQAEISRASKELQALQESQRKYVGGALLWPLPIKSYVSSGFGGRTSPITGRWELHNGVDLPAPYGTSIYAANDGVVIIATYGAGYGNYIVIDHGGGITTLYAHCSSFVVKTVGAKVKRGDIIAKVGSTGWSTGNHLHFSYIENGTFKDPLQNGLVKP